MSKEIPFDSIIAWQFKTARRTIVFQASEYAEYMAAAHKTGVPYELTPLVKPEEGAWFKGPTPGYKHADLCDVTEPDLPTAPVPDDREAAALIAQSKPLPDSVQLAAAAAPAMRSRCDTYSAVDDGATMGSMTKRGPAITPPVCPKCLKHHWPVESCPEPKPLPEVTRSKQTEIEARTPHHARVDHDFRDSGGKGMYPPGYDTPEPIDAKLCSHVGHDIPEGGKRCRRCGIEP